MPAEPGARRRRLVVGACGLALAAAICAVAWWWLRVAAAPMPANVPLAADSAAEAALRAAAMRWLGAAASGPPTRASAPSAGLPGAVDDASCPSTWRELAGQPADAIDRVFRRLQPRALGRAAVLLGASSDPFERLAGQLLAARAGRPDQPPSPQAMLSLVSEALASQDPRVASLAVQLCDSPRFDAAAACSSISPDRWAAVDPDNLQAWLTVAAHAQDQGDVVTVREAMARAARARASRDIGAEMIRLAASPTLRALDPIDRQVLVMDMFNANTALSLAGTFAMARLCPPDSMGPVRMAQCSAVAELLVDRSQTLSEQGIGITIGRRVGWDAERIATLEQEHRALMEAHGEAMLFWPTEPERSMTREEACGIYRRVDAITQLVITDTELGLARRALGAARAASAVSAAR